MYLPIQVLSQNPLKNSIKFILKDGVIEVCAMLKNYLLFLVTNQPDVSKGFNSKINVENINSYLQKKLFLDQVLVCYSDDEKNYFRKPIQE